MSILYIIMNNFFFYIILLSIYRFNIFFIFLFFYNTWKLFPAELVVPNLKKERQIQTIINGCCTVGLFPIRASRSCIWGWQKRTRPANLDFSRGPTCHMEYAPLARNEQTTWTMFVESPLIPFSANPVYIPRGTWTPHSPARDHMLFLLLCHFFRI